MRFKLHTTVDITKTNARRGDDKHQANQQANYNTVYQTIGLRVNIDPIGIDNEVTDVKDLGFGSNVKGKHNVWTFTFDNPYEDALSIDMLVNDFDLVPVISNLDDTHSCNIFRTICNKDTNIVFKIVG